MSDATPNRHLVPFDASFRVADAPTAPPEAGPDGKDDTRGKSTRKRLKKLREELAELQRILYAHDHHALLLIFQALDAAGKDGTIRAVMQGVNPAGCQVSSYKQPSAEELDHDFLWRTAMDLPERGRIGIFNRSYYEETLVVRVHPEFLEYQRLPGELDMTSLWDERFESIRDHEKHLARNGTVIRKFWLNISYEEQRRRFLSRLDEPEKNWKFSAGDVQERAFWADYMHAYEAALNATSRPWAPWYAIPADDKGYMREQVAQIVVRTLRDLGLAYPQVDEAARATFESMRAHLLQEPDAGA